MNTAKLFALSGHEIRGFDTSPTVRDQIRETIGSTAVASSLAELADCQVVFECLPTDPDEHGACDLTLVSEAIASFARLEGQHGYSCQIFVQRSTCPPGTAKQLSRYFADTEYVVNPSFLHKISQWQDTLNPERIAIAGSRSSIESLLALYNKEDAPVFTSDCYEVVEFLKYTENITDAVLISLWNEFMSISDTIEIPRGEFVRMMESFGDRDKFRTSLRVPGQAFGLWCLPKDIRAIVHQYQSMMIPIETIKGALATNERIAQAYGENKLSGSQLADFTSGSLRLTELGVEYLSSARKGDKI